MRTHMQVADPQEKYERAAVASPVVSSPEATQPWSGVRRTSARTPAERLLRQVPGSEESAGTSRGADRVGPASARVVGGGRAGPGGGTA